MKLKNTFTQDEEAIHILRQFKQIDTVCFTIRH